MAKKRRTYKQAIEGFRKEKRKSAQPNLAARVDLGNRLRFLREEKGLYQHEVARKLKPPVWPQTLAKWETGEIGVNMERIAELAKIYGVKVRDIFGALSKEGVRGSESSEQAESDRGEDREA